MALISATTIITSISLYHLTMAYFFLTNPAVIADQALVWVLGSSMGMPHVRSFDTRSPQLALLSLVLAYVGVSDLISLSMPEEISILYHWGTQAPLRLSVSLIVVVYTFFTGSSRPLAGAATSSHGFSHAKPSALDGLRNDLVFTFAFIQVVSWFWVWVTIREERVEIVRKGLENTRQQNERDD